MRKVKNADPAAPFLIDYLIEDLYHGDTKNASGSLGMLNSYCGFSIDKRAVEPLIKALKDSDWDTRMNAALVLGSFKDLGAVEPLINALNDSLTNVRDNAAKSLTKITGENFGTDQAKWIQWWKQNENTLQAKNTSSKATYQSVKKSPILPNFGIILDGENEVRILNPNTFEVAVGIRSGNHGKDLEVSSNGKASIFIPNGKYEIYFVYSNKPDALFQGDSFTLHDNGVEIQIVKVVGGNYRIKRVK